jgi:hypothetical protein
MRLRDTRHIAILTLLIAAAGAGFLMLRERMIPQGFGQQGPYRAAALTEIAARPSVLQEDSLCLKCHVDVGKERADALHKSVACMHCHGLGREHVAQAREAAGSPSTRIEPAARWDGDFLTRTDLFITKDRATCLACHEQTVGMPGKFRKIVVASHLGEMGASEPESRETCFECHGGHNTAP